MENYIGVKEVIAKPMTRIEYNNYRGWELPEDEKRMENDEGYLVEYTNSPNSNHPNHKGYISWSPKAVFDESYRQTNGMTFGLAIESLKSGRCVARKGWNGKGMFIYKALPNTVPAEIVPKMISLPEDAKKLISEAIVFGSAMTIVKPDGTADSWVASSSDTFAEDWYVVE